MDSSGLINCWNELAFQNQSADKQQVLKSSVFIISSLNSSPAL